MPSDNGRKGGGWAVVAVVAMLLMAGGGWLAYAAFPGVFAAALQVVGGGAAYPEIDPADAQQVALGEEVYAAQCASCHGADLEGAPNWRRKNPDGTLKPPPHDETGHTWHHGDELLFRVVKHGGQSIAPDGFTSRMPAFGEILDDRKIAAVLAYIESEWPRSVRQRRAARQAQQ